MNKKRMPRPHAEHLGAVDARSGRRPGREDHALLLLLRRGNNRLRGCTADLEPGIAPIGVVAVDAVAGVAHHEQKRLDTFQAYVHNRRGLSPTHHAAFPQQAIVAEHAENDATVAGAVFAALSSTPTWAVNRSAPPLRSMASR